MKAKELISKTAFWDVDFDAINFEKDSDFVIQKVFNYGLGKDMDATRYIYGKAKVKKALLNATYLTNDVRSFAQIFFNLSPEKFACFKRKQLSQELWPY